MITPLFCGLLFFWGSHLVSASPVKVSMTLMLMSLSIFMMIMKSDASSWLSLTFLLLFIGGIMVMFMIISSLLPNEKAVKKKTLNWPVLILVILTPKFFMNASGYEGQMFSQIKWFFQSSNNFEFLMIIVFSYFLSSMCMICKKNSSLRSEIC